MRGARHYRPDVPTRIKKCSEHLEDGCGCCAVTPCTYCLELEIYGEAIQYGTAEQSASHWTGTVGGYAFDAFWERNYLTDVCEFVVELAGEEVYREPCGYITCRDSSAETDVVVGYPAQDAVLRWTKHEPLELPHITSETGCKTFFCGECECSCECLCVTITEPDGTVSTGEICNVAYECEGPIWSGLVGYYDLTIVLGRDIYGECIITATVDGEEQEPVFVTGCKDMSATVVLYDGTTIAVRCKICTCEVLCEPCPDPSQYPVLTASVYPIANCGATPVNVTCVFDVISQSWFGKGPWAPSGGDEMNVRLSCVGNSFMGQIQLTLSGTPVSSCQFGATSPTNQDCALLLYDWEFRGSLSGFFCCGGGTIGSDIGVTVIL